MHIPKNRIMILSPVVVLLVVFIFSLTMIPTINPTPKNLPIAIVNEDAGIKIPNQSELNMGKTIVKNIQEATNSKSEKTPPIKWVVVNSYKEVQTGLNNQEYYAALVIPKDFSLKQATFKTTAPVSPEIQIMINQGMSSTASNIVAQMLNGLVDHMNDNIRTQLLQGYEKAGVTLSKAQATALISPIARKLINVNEVGTNSAGGNSPISLFQPLWIASLIGAALLYSAMKNNEYNDKKGKLIDKLKQLGYGVVIAAFAGFGLTWIASGLLGLHIPHITSTALFLTLSYLSFFLMVLAVISWTGIGGIFIFVLILFFGAPLLVIPPELMSSFYHNFVYSWLPMRFTVAGLRELFFFGKSFSLNGPAIVLVGISITSLLVLLASAIKPESKKA
jgi:YhgE/Pip-like protein